jgi:hypothetical protein
MMQRHHEQGREKGCDADSKEAAIPLAPRGCRFVAGTLATRSHAALIPASTRPELFK